MRRHRIRRARIEKRLRILGLCLVLGCFIATAAHIAPGVAAEQQTLPERAGPRPETTQGVPHIQLGAKADPALAARLLDRMSETPGVEIGQTVISLPGAKGFWVEKGVKITRPQNIVGGREFAHMHPDGSLHATLSPAMAQRAVAAGWAIHHPWANQRPGWEGFVLIYTPRTEPELDVVTNLVLSGFAYLTGPH